MIDSSVVDRDAEMERRPSRRRAAGSVGLAGLVTICAAGFTLRIIGVSTSPMTFHSARQYLSLRVARAEFLEGRDVPPWRLEVARAHERNAPELEPRLLETVTVVGYRVVGSERIWMGGLLSSVMWTLGGVCLFLIARRLASDLAAVVAVGLYMLLPYGVVASRSFQPDPTMVAVMLASILAMVRYRDVPTARRFVVAAGLAGLASLMKPSVYFALIGAFLALAVARSGWRRAGRSATTWSFVVLAAAPGGLFYAYGIATGGALGSSAGRSFLPRLWFEEAYWQGWASIIHVTVGIAFAILALVGAVSARRREARWLMVGLFSGYLVFGLTFSYHIHTHDYYSLQLVPVVALGVGFGTDAAVLRLRRLDIGGAMRTALVVAVLGLAGSTVYAAVRLALPRPPEAVEASIEQAELIGSTVSHSTKAVTMAVASGAPLQYHGEFAGPTWPNSGELELARLQGLARSTAERRLGRLVGSGAEWFVITDFGELARQPEVRRLLDQRARLAAESDGYLIYDLRDYGRAGSTP